MAYCTAADIGVILQLTYSTTSQPTQVQVEAIIDQVAAEIDLRLQTAGLSLPVSDATTLQYLKTQNINGAVCRVGMSYKRNADSVTGTQADYFCQLYKDFITEIKETPEDIVGIIGGGTVYTGSNVLDGVVTEEHVTDNMVKDDFVW